MIKVLGAIGLILMILGGSAMDSASMVMPIVMLLAGLLILLYAAYISGDLTQKNRPR